VDKEKPFLTETLRRLGEQPPQDWETPFRRLEGVTIDPAPIDP
jgi:hypothetical protein